MSTDDIYSRLGSIEEQVRAIVNLLNRGVTISPDGMDKLRAMNTEMQLFEVMRASLPVKVPKKAPGKGKGKSTGHNIHKVNTSERQEFVSRYSPADPEYVEKVYAITSTFGAENDIDFAFETGDLSAEQIQAEAERIWSAMERLPALRELIRAVI
jgi:hypothetical protein